MAVNKGLRSLVEASPNFSNQALENAVNELKIGWVIKSVELDTAIENNTVLTTSQKNDLKDDINNIAHLNLGRVLGDLIRHSASIIDGTIIPLEDLDNPVPATFLEILQNVQTVQGLIPELYGVPATDKKRSVNDHLGTLNNIFLSTTDGTAPVFITLRESIEFIATANLATESALETAYDDLRSFIASVTDDSTDFQQTLDTFATAVANAHTNFNNALASEPYLTHRTRITEMRDKINTQVALENSNLVGIDTYIETLSNNISYTTLAEDEEMRQLMVRVAQDKTWQTYFEDYQTNFNNLNPIFTTDTDSDKSTVIDQVLASRGLPDVLDPLDLEAVANKAKRDTRVDTKNYDHLRTEQQITKSCEQLGIRTVNRSIYDQSRSLLNNLNQQDRDIVANELDLNESSNTLS